MPLRAPECNATLPPMGRRNDLVHFQVRISPELHERLLAVAAGEERQLKTIATRALQREVDGYEARQDDAYEAAAAHEEREARKKKASSKKKTKAA